MKRKELFKVLIIIPVLAVNGAQTVYAQGINVRQGQISEREEYSQLHNVQFIETGQPWEEDQSGQQVQKQEDAGDAEKDLDSGEPEIEEPEIEKSETEEPEIEESETEEPEIEESETEEPEIEEPEIEESETEEPETEEPETEKTEPEEPEPKDSEAENSEPEEFETEDDLNIHEEQQKNNMVTEEEEKEVVQIESEQGNAVKKPPAKGKEAGKRFKVREKKRIRESEEKQKAESDGSNQPEQDPLGEAGNMNITDSDSDREMPLNSAAVVMKRPEKRYDRPLSIINNLSKLSSNQIPVLPKISIQGSVLKDGVEICIRDGNGKEIYTSPKLIQSEKGIQCLFPEIEEDGFYVMRIKGKDQVGQTAESKFAFTVNKRGTVFQYDKTQKNVRLKKAFTPRIKIDNLDSVTVLSCMINGKEIPYLIERDTLHIDQSIVRAGKNKITLEVKDAAGNLSSMEPWEFYVEKKESVKCSGKNDKSSQSSGFWKLIICKLLGIIFKSPI